MGRLEIEGHGKTVRYYSPYHPDLVDDLKAQIPYSARKPGFEKPFYWEVSAQYVPTLDKLSEKYFGDVPMKTGTILQPRSETFTVLIEYMGLLRHRGGDVYTASGWVDGDWNLTFPADVLQRHFNFVMRKPDINATKTKARVKKVDTRTIYEVLSIAQSASGREIKKAYRRAARTWHPDVCSEPDAEEQFQKIQAAYETLQNPAKRAKYDAFMRVTSDSDVAQEVDTIPSTSKDKDYKDDGDVRIDWRPPVRCGNVKIKAVFTMGRYMVEEILAWDDIVNTRGETMVTSWNMTLNNFEVKWA